MISSSVNRIKIVALIVFLIILGPKGFSKEKRNLVIGYSVAIKNVTLEKMKYAKSVGIDCIETSIAEFIDKKNRTFLQSDEEIIERLKAAKASADEAGINVWSIHMPFSPEIDLSLSDETERKKVVAFHQKVIRFCAILQPEIILFHPSYFLERNERELRKSQLIKSAIELNSDVKKIEAKMVIENMLGKDLVRPDAKQEWPLLRDVKETEDVMSRLPESIGSAIDFNHISNPENLILAMGKRLASIHVADGDGLKERHYLPCSGEGTNDWNAILAALDKVNYKGPFLYECHFKDVAELKSCYNKLYSNYKEQH